MTFLRPALIATLVLAAVPAAAQETVRVRGEVTALSDDTLTILATDGQDYDVQMQPDYTLLLYQPITIDEVTVGDFLSIPAIPLPEGGQQALSINVFPEELRGTNEGITGWDLTPDSVMTNATVGTLDSRGDGGTLVVTFQEEEETVEVPDGTPITSFAPVADRRLAVGDQAVVFVQQADGGGLVSGLAGVTADGTLPPI